MRDTLFSGNNVLFARNYVWNARNDKLKKALFLSYQFIQPNYFAYDLQFYCFFAAFFGLPVCLFC